MKRAELRSLSPRRMARTEPTGKAIAMAKDLHAASSQPQKEADRKPPRAALGPAEGGDRTIRLSGDHDRILTACGNLSVAEGLVAQAVMLGSRGKRTDPMATDFVLGHVDAMQPGDAAEALLLSQMAVTHQAVMMLAARLNRAANPQQLEAAERALNKTARTYAAQMDTLKRYRSKGQQVVRVERVTVEDGGQAIVGNVGHRGAGR